MINVNGSSVKKISWEGAPIKRAYFNRALLWQQVARGTYAPTDSTVLYLPLNGDLTDRATGSACELSGAGEFIDTAHGKMYQLNGASFLTPPQVPATIANPYTIKFISIVFQYRKNTQQAFVFYGNSYGYYNQYIVDMDVSYIYFRAFGAGRTTKCSLAEFKDGAYYLVSWTYITHTEQLFVVNGVQQAHSFDGSARHIDNISNPTPIRQVGCGHAYNNSANSGYAVSPFCEVLIESRTWTLDEMQGLARLLGFE